MRLIKYIKLRMDGYSINAARALSELHADEDDIAVGWALLIIALAYMVAS